MPRILFTLALFLLTACSHDEPKVDHISLARKHMATFDYAAAAVELQNALEENGDSAEARWLLGKAYFEAGDALAAEIELLRAEALGWSPVDVRTHLAEVLLLQAKFGDVLKLDYQDLDPVAAAQLLSTQARAALSEGRADKAADLVSVAMILEPQSVAAILAEAALAIHRGDPADAKTRVEQILVAEPENARAWAVLGQALVKLQAPKEARAAFDQSIAHSNNNRAERVERSLLNLQLHEEDDAAQANANGLLQLSPNDPAGNYLRGLLYYRGKHYHEAISALTKAKSAASQFPLVLYYLGMSHLNEKDTDLAVRFAREFVIRSPEDSNGRKLLAAILLQQDRIEEALERMQPVLYENPDDIVSLNIMANALLLDDQADAALALYSRVAQLQPDWHIVPLREEVDLIIPASDRDAVEDTEPETDNAVSNPQAHILSILDHLHNNDFPAAIEAAKSYQFRELESLEPYLVLGRVYLAADKPVEAQAAFRKVLKEDRGSRSANEGMAKMALAANDPAAARRHYETILRHHVDDMDALLHLAELEGRENGPEAMAALLEQAIVEHPEMLEPRLRLGRYYIDTGKPLNVLPLFAKISKSQRQSPAVRQLIFEALSAHLPVDSAPVTPQQEADVIP